MDVKNNGSFVAAQEQQVQAVLQQRAVRHHMAATANCQSAIACAALRCWGRREECDQSLFFLCLLRRHCWLHACICTHPTLSC